MRIISYKTSIKEGKILLEESTGKHVLSNSLEQLFSFLVEPYDATIKVCWNLDATVSLFLRLFPPDVTATLQKTHKCRSLPYNIFYMPGKTFNVSHIPTKFQARLYELQQYFPDLPEPDTLEELQMLGKFLIEELRKMGMTPTKLTSPVAIFEECIMSKLSLPSISDIPLPAAEMAYNCSGRLWIESHQIGFFENIFDYDLSSAFPTIAKSLIDIRGCDWVQSTQHQPKAVYGYVRCRVTIYDWVMVSPILCDTNNSLLSPTGTWDTFLTKGELDFISRHGIGHYEIQDGWWAIPNKTLTTPLWSPMTKLLSYKGRSALQTLLSKRMSTGIYGKMGEEHTNEFGKYFNPCYFAEISTQTRLRVAEFLYAFGIGAHANPKYNTLLHIGVDGVLLTEPVPPHGDTKWRLSYEGKALIVSSGLVYTERTKPKGLTLSDILTLIKEHPRKSYYEKVIERRVTIGDPRIKVHPEEIGTKKKFVSSINLLRQDHDRSFPKTPNSGEQLLNNRYSSFPLNI